MTVWWCIFIGFCPRPVAGWGQFPKYLYIFLVFFVVVAQSDFLFLFGGASILAMAKRLCFSFRFAAFKVPKVSILVLGDILDYLTTGRSLRQGYNNFSEPVIWIRSLFCWPWFWFTKRFLIFTRFLTTRNFHSLNSPNVKLLTFTFVFFLAWQKLCNLLYTTQYEKRSPLNNQYSGTSMSAKMSPYCPTRVINEVMGPL